MQSHRASKSKRAGTIIVLCRRIVGARIESRATGRRSTLAAVPNEGSDKRYGAGNRERHVSNW
jgi:hypothetical protein